MDKGLELFFRFGVKTVTMDEIATGLGISKKTIYQHFPDKDTLVYEVVEHFTAMDGLKWQELDQAYPDVIEKIAKVYEIMKDTLSDLNPRLLSEIKKYHPKAYELFQQYKERVMKKQLLQDMKRGVELGYFRSDIHLPLIADLREAEMDLLLDPTFTSPFKMSFVELHYHLLDYFMRGICTEKGLKVYQKYLNKL